MAKITEKVKERFILQTDTTKIQGYEQAGSLDEWREQVSQVCLGNHRLVMAMSAAFAAPLLNPLEQQGFGINIHGGSSAGKTTALRAGKSVMGDPEHIGSWKQTATALESTAAQHNDNTLFLDEMGQLDPKDAGDVAYMLANGKGKARGKRSGGLREALVWRLIFLSSGEVSLSGHMAQAKQKAKAGQMVRLIDLPADAGQGLGLFDVLPDGFDHGGAFADHLKTVTQQYHGTAFIAFLEALVKDMPGHLQTVKNYRAQWREAYMPGGYDSQVGRVADAFATIAAGGELATDFGITGWHQGDAGASAAVCFNAWISQRGGVGNQEEKDIINHVRNHFEEHGAAKYAYIELRPQDDKTMYRMGYRDDNGDYFVLPSRFESELCKAGGFDRKQVIAVLTDAGYLLVGASDRPTITKRVYSLDLENVAPEKKPVRVYHIDSSVIGGGE